MKIILLEELFVYIDFNFYIGLFVLGRLFVRIRFFKVPLTQNFFFIVLKDRIQYIALVKTFFNFIKYCGFYCALNMEFAGPAPLS